MMDNVNVIGQANKGGLTIIVINKGGFSVKDGLSQFQDRFNKKKQINVYYRGSVRVVSGRVKGSG